MDDVTRLLVFHEPPVQSRTVLEFERALTPSERRRTMTSGAMKPIT